MQAAFATWIRRHPDDGRYVLCNGYDWTYFSVDDVAYFVRGVRSLPEGLEIELSDSTAERLDPATLRLGARDALYCQIKGGDFAARFCQGAQTALLPYLVEGPAGEPQLELSGRRFPIGA